MLTLWYFLAVQLLSLSCRLLLIGDMCLSPPEVLQVSRPALPKDTCRLHNTDMPSQAQAGNVILVKMERQVPLLLDHHPLLPSTPS
ncbi:uncharacterized protein LY79DRAFT_100268 [Colletotrichum navitas]|uniref:Secreted protein n=1 Tax=Colletotrichum navitas TaxID=681940 RepID=A0AAD8Q447_9PEZI|nr:uncharacterized protein LY79DRAFT_100268 [Colletotrichum navitas]KAK1595493.1 hypothetical protein LY79DRAFT_100268 [Colletotrichum navitas]